jgi:hypothetical protein
VRQCHLARRICFERLKNLFLGERGGGEGGLFGLLRGRLGPPEYNRIELTTFARQNRMGSKL